MSGPADPNKFFDDLETVVYGCHAELADEIQQVFDDAGIYTYSFAEYFIDEPVTALTATDNALASRKLYFPFLPWSASQLLFRVNALEGGGGTKFLAKTREWKNYLREACRLGTSLAGPFRYQADRIKSLFDNEWIYEELIVDKSPLDNFKSVAESLGSTNPHVLNEAKVSYEIQLHLWGESDLSEDAPLVIQRVPITSGHCYYGQFLVVYQERRPVSLSSVNDKIVGYKNADQNNDIPI